MIDVTVVVPAFGDPSLPARLLRGIDSQAAAAGVTVPVVVADDASPEPMAPVLGALSLRSVDLRIVRADTNGGPGAARNLALRHVGTTWVASIDADMEAGEGWVEALLRATTEAADSVDVIEGRVDVPSTEPATPFTHATEFSDADTHHGAGNVVHRRAALLEVGGFDERFYDPRRRLHFREDTDLYFRLHAAGASSVYDDALVALHPPLPSSYAAPIRLARRYHFDPLLAQKHPDAFRAMNERRRVGPVSLRRARHLAATATVGGAALAGAGAVSRTKLLTAAGGALGVSGWAATAVGLAWRRSVRPAHLAPLAAISAAVPWVYLWHYWRGVVRFRHRPRL